MRGQVGGCETSKSSTTLAAPHGTIDCTNGDRGRKRVTADWPVTTFPPMSDQQYDLINVFVDRLTKIGALCTMQGYRVSSGLCQHVLGKCISVAWCLGLWVT
jgi:hypothetical protein